MANNLDEMTAGIDERAIAREMSPDIAWPSLIFSILLPIAHLALVGLGLAGVIGIWTLMPILGVTAYMHYTIVHEAIHRNIVRRHRGFDRVNTALGWIGSIAIGTTWPLLHRTHLSHHADTNTPDDADYFLKGSYARLLFIWVVSIVANLIPVPVVKWAFDKAGFDSGYLNTRHLMTEREWQLHLIAHTGLCAFVWGMIAIGFGPQVIALFVMPAAIGRLLLGTFQQWLPHAPFTESSRYRQARITKVPGGPLWYMGHDVHLVHHLWPSVPFYAYGRFYRRIEPLLRARGARIEGLIPQQPAHGDDGATPARS
ncbi:MAG: hypothetical protein ABS87_10580 [Sphingomonas sp. SCN 67-18]|uniref:fatty acid desaturase n=1 Tax=uncultured Sphingomonas sp. TaxID=158754 RepID=UPI00086D6E93|nr:fatty acid desaturase [Sphingomonas sp. SCN 67-18]ODU20480.1 MAG: hypothetical protein ABS87_10580 [Sphingomonas sp. SCN 67-18]